jgi:hypothetical protein
MEELLEEMISVRSAPMIYRDTRNLTWLVL